VGSSTEGSSDSGQRLVAVEWLALMLHISEVSGSNLGLETGYPEFKFFVVFFCPSRQMLG
jgi:hypothetical protein